VFIVDAHLDLSYNALRGRDVLQPAAFQQPDSQGIPSVGLPDLRAGQAGLICATIFCPPAGSAPAGEDMGLLTKPTPPPKPISIGTTANLPLDK
jgi:hypothetical protein